MSGRLLLLRHGETTSNAAHALDTRPPGAPLTELGESQARQIVERLASHQVCAVHCSVAVRAQQTAAPLAAALGLPVQVEQGVHETDVGRLENRSDDAAHEEFTDVYRRWLAGERDLRVPGGESAQEVLDRYLLVVARLRDELAGGDVVLVSHGAAIRLVGAVLADVDGGFALAHRLENTAWLELEPTRDGWECLRWGAQTPPFLPPEPGEEPAEPI